MKLITSCFRLKGTNCNFLKNNLKNKIFYNFIRKELLLKKYKKLVDFIFLIKKKNDMCPWWSTFNNLF